ncbi:interferon-induced, double-stranded RNA-activated protein kinase isoform X1 [Cygnus olor]|uniref:interferon-induced, double-stranded RNA-activated protein kinase isoform X1 n=3 Tax=Cygnus olor TaxID=8869 RepID=UPI001ADE53D5|nr:interferon-induced, double-stranded RNA-activated protein kinase isoform X1 [Cygnus olor]
MKQHVKRAFVLRYCVKMERECMGKINSYCQKNKLQLDYVTVDRTGPSHDPEFKVVVKINNVEYGKGTAKSKKEARAVAAKNTWEMIEQEQNSLSNMQAPEQMMSPVTSPCGLAVDVRLSVDYVSRLNEYSQKTLQVINYNNTNRVGDAHEPTFYCSCTISGHVYGRGTGNSLGAAKQAAAKEAYEKLRELESLTTGSEKSITSSSASEPNSPGESVQSGGIHFKDSNADLVEKMRDMLPSEKASPLQRIGQNSAMKSTRKLAANFNNANNKEEKKMSDSNKSLPNTSEENEYTADERFLKDYKNIEPIGEGGFGNVFKATAKTDEITYAVKRVELKMKEKREVHGLAGLQHENIVRYYCSWEGLDYVTYPDSRQRSRTKRPCLFIQIEFCEQGTLEDWIENNRRNRRYHERAQNKFLQILEGVNYIHSKGLIHRDLKPQNIFISRDDKIKIGDFGLVTSVAYETLTENRGTKSYMAPEQVFDKYGKEVDIYALGLIWFEILSALASHHEKNMVWHDVRESKFPEDFTERFKTQVPIIRRMLSKDASKRPRASEILELLKSVDKDNSLKAHTQ